MARLRQFALPLIAVAALGLLAAIAATGAEAVSLYELAVYLLAGGLLSFGLTVAVARWLRRGHGPLWLQLTLTASCGVVVALVNALLTVQAMLFSSDDLPRLLLLLLFAGVISLALGVSLAATIGHRVGALNQGARTIAGGDLSARVSVGGSDELAALATEFNRMASLLAEGAAERERQEAARRELVAAVSHDLRTPLASLRALTDALADGVVDDPATAARYYATMRGQIDHLSALIDDLFELAQLDAGVLRLERVALDPADLVSDTLNSLSPQAAAHGVDLIGSAERSPQALVAPQKIERVLYNLVANAIRHTPPGGSVRVSVRPWERTPPGAPASTLVLFEVTDTGEGIAAEDLPHIFERFYRGEKSRSRATGGAGLGLAIARGIVEAHGGQIWAESERGRGTTVRFTVPSA